MDPAVDEQEDREEIPEGDTDGEDPGTAKPKKGRLRPFGMVGRFLTGHRWLVGTAVLLILLLGMGVPRGMKLLEGRMKPLTAVTPAGGVRDDLKEEMLSPFLIPLPPESSKEAVVIDLSVIWDGVASLRFRKMEMQIRNRLYEYLLELAEKGKDFQEKTSFLEVEMSRMFRESLGREELAVRIRNIKVL